MSHNLTDSGSFDMTPSDASRLLRLGMADERRPVDDLIDGLKAKEAGPRTLIELLERPGLIDPGQADGMLIQGEAGIDHLQGLKQRGKICYKNADSDAERMAGLAAYFLAIGAALAHHGKLICSRSREELDQVLLDIAEVAPEPWDEMLNKAIAVPWA